MKDFVKSSWKLYFILVSAISLILFTLPINLFPGEISINYGGATSIIPRNLSLSYFIGFGYEADQIKDFNDFYLLTQGKILAAIVLFGLPFLVVYRIFIHKELKAQEQGSK